MLTEMQPITRVTAAPDCQAQSMAEEHKARVRRGFEEIWSNGNWALALETYHADIVLHTPTHPAPIVGREGVRALWNELRTAYPDLHMRVDDAFAEGDTVGVRITMTGTNLGPQMGMPPTGKRVTIVEFGIFRFQGDQVTELRLMMDTMSLGRQLGLVPDGPPPKVLLLTMGALARLGKLLPKRGVPH